MTKFSIEKSLDGINYTHAFYLYDLADAIQACKNNTRYGNVYRYRLI